MVFAWLAERADAADRVAAPVLLAARVEPKAVAEMSMRDSLDRWLSAPSADVTAAETELLKYLGAA